MFCIDDNPLFGFLDQEKLLLSLLLLLLLLLYTTGRIELFQRMLKS
jgi:hypothetical protein